MDVVITAGEGVDVGVGFARKRVDTAPVVVVVRRLESRILSYKQNRVRLRKEKVKTVLVHIREKHLLPSFLEKNETPQP